MTQVLGPALAEGRYQGVVLVVALMAQATGAVALFAITPLSPLVRQELGLSYQQLGLLTSAFFLGTTVAAIPMGWLADRLGVRRVLAAGQVALGLFVAGVAVAGSFEQAAALMALAGLGFGAVNPATTKAVLEWFSPRKRAVAMSIKQTGGAIGGLLAAGVLPGLALLVGGWRVALGMVAVLVILSAGATFLVYREAPGSPGEAGPIPKRRGQGLQHSARANLWLLSLAVTAYAGVQLSFVTYLPLYMQEQVLLPIVVAGGLLALAQACGIVGRIALAFISDRLFQARRKVVLVAVGVTTAATCLLLARLTAGSAPWAPALLVGLFGLSGLSWGGLYFTFLGEVAGQEMAGTAAGTGMALTGVGAVLGPALFGSVLDATGSYSLALSLLAVPATLGALMLLFTQEGKQPAAARIRGFD